MPRRSRVDPWGRLIAVPSRGAYFGNRGCLHDDHGVIRKSHQLQRWIICELEFKGRRRELMVPGRYNELFFWDEATALAAGHRPCAECRRDSFNRFRDAWANGSGSGSGRRILALELDGLLHRERLDDAGGKRTYRADLSGLPDGTFVLSGESADACLIWRGTLRPWRHDGYLGPAPLGSGSVEVLTPRSTVAALRGGYLPQVRL